MGKVCVVGGGQVGSTCANLLVQEDVADVVLIDIVEGLPQGKALDIMQSAPILKFSQKIVGTNQFSDLAGSDIVVITAGSARKPGMTRTDLLKFNAKVVKSVTEQIVKYASSSIILAVTNPVDVMAYLVFKTSGFDNKRVIGVSGVLDSARFAYFLSEGLNIPISEVNALVIGAHDDTMLPLEDHSTAGGQPVSSRFSPDALQEIVERTRRGGAEIVACLKTGSAFYAPAAAAAHTVKTILANEQKVLPSSAFLDGQYGLDDLYIGVPCKLGGKGIMEIIELDLTSREEKALQKSAQAIKDKISALGV